MFYELLFSTIEIDFFATKQTIISNTKIHHNQEENITKISTTITSTY